MDERREIEKVHARAVAREVACLEDCRRPRSARLGCWDGSKAVDNSAMAQANGGCSRRPTGSFQAGQGGWVPPELPTSVG